MTRMSTRKFSANEKEISGLLKENESWKKFMFATSQEIHFLNSFLNADIFQKNILNLYEKLQDYLDRLEVLQSESMEINTEIRNHHYDVEGMLECEDISCEIFYHDKHLNLEKRIEAFKEKFESFKLEVFSYTSNVLRKSSKEH